MTNLCASAENTSIFSNRNVVFMNTIRKFRFKFYFNQCIKMWLKKKKNTNKC